MYVFLLVLHNFLRWVVLLSAVAALVAVYRGIIQKRSWGTFERASGIAFTSSYGLQIVLGLVLYVISPLGMRALGMLMTTDIREVEVVFFGAFHIFVMILAFVPAQLGYSLSKRAEANGRKYMWAAVGYSLGTLGILVAIPWWRPLLRMF
ncbi:MAG: hypothetical protein AAF708_10630 [Deinococcota bacterium]